MKFGLLIFNDSAAPLTEVVAQAAARYRRKFRREPNRCFVHPSAIDKAWTKIGDVLVYPRRNVLRHHFWIGKEEKSGR